MNVNSKLVSIQGKTDREEPLFSPGALLQADDLAAIGGYSKSLIRLMFNSLFGCGVVCGLVVRAVEECSKLCITVECGVALDRCGNPVQVPGTQKLAIDLCGRTIDYPLWVVLRHTEKGCAPRTAICSEDDEELPSVCTRSREGFEISVLKELPECACRCGPGAAAVTQDLAATTPAAAPSEANPCRCADADLDCHHEHYQGECGCACSECCECEWIVLAHVKNESTDRNVPNWTVDHRYRRFVRPVLMRDPQVAREQALIQAQMQARRAQQMPRAGQGGAGEPESEA